MIVEGVAEGVDLEFAAVAGAGVDVPDREAAPERPLGRFLDRRPPARRVPDRRPPARLRSAAAEGPAAACCASQRSHPE